MNDTSGGYPHQYEIRLAGHLGPRWDGWFDGMTVTNHSDGTSVIHGPIVDQARLHGLLRQLRDVGLPLISVTPIGAAAASLDTLNPGA